MSGNCGVISDIGSTFLVPTIPVGTFTSDWEAYADWEALLPPACMLRKALLLMTDTFTTTYIRGIFLRKVSLVEVPKMRCYFTVMVPYDPRKYFLYLFVGDISRLP